MIKNKISITLFLGVAAIGLCFGSCSVFKRTGSVEKEVVLPSDRETLHQPKNVKVYTSEDLAKGIIRGDWTIDSVGGEVAKGMKTPYLRFEPEQKRVYGNDGCNVINGNYNVNPSDSTISFDNMVSTMMACGDDLTDLKVNQGINLTRRYDWRLDGEDYVMHFLSEDGSVLMTLRHCNFEFLTGAWHVVAIEGEPSDIAEMNLVFDVDEGKIHGNTGCNILNGKLETDNDTPNSISFSSIATTRMTCPDFEGEMRLLVALEEASSARALSKDRIQLLGSNRQPVLELVRIDPSQMEM